MENPEKQQRIQALFNGEISMIYYDGFMYVMYDFFRHNGQMYCMRLTDLDFEIFKITDEWFSSKVIYNGGYKDGYMLVQRHKNVPVMPNIFHCGDHCREICRLTWRVETLQRDMYCFLDKNNNLIFLNENLEEITDIYMEPDAPLNENYDRVHGHLNTLEIGVTLASIIKERNYKLLTDY